MENREASQGRQWFKLDNAGKIFPGQNTGRWSNVFRASVYLNEPVDRELLGEALKKTLPRFPCFDVRIRRGIFWYYFERQQGVEPPIMDDIGNPCHRVSFKENNRYLFRVYVYGNRLSVEFFHALADAYGSAVFLCTLTAVYLNLKGACIPSGGMVLDVDSEPNPEELEDAFLRYASSKARIKRSSDYVYHASGTRLPAHMINVTTGYIDCKAFHNKAKELGVTVTELSAAILLDILYRKQLNERRRQKKVSVQVPVNLRRHFPTKTLRNFSLCYNVKLNPAMGEYSFEEILKYTSLYLRLINNPKELNAMMTKNMGLERNPIMRLMPLFIKRLGIYTAAAISAEKTVSALFSNMGIITLPPEIQPYIDRFMLMTGPGKLNGARIAAVTYGDTFAVTFADIYSEHDVEREFFTRIVKMGIHVKIESNREQGGDA